MDDNDLVNDLRLTTSKIEVAPSVSTTPKQNTISVKTENTTRPHGNSDSEMDPSKVISVEMSPRCSDDYEKIIKKGDPKLIDQIDAKLKILKTDPKHGKKLKENLQGEYSITLKQYGYRIIYKIKKSPSMEIVVQSIGHRNHVYDDRARYSESPKNILT